MTDATFTVGDGGHFSTLTEALRSLSPRRRPGYAVAGRRIEVRLLSGFVLAEQILLTDIDLGMLTITSEDATVTITRSALTTQFGVGNRYPAFGFERSVAPVIDALFNMDASGSATDRNGFHFGQASRGHFETGAGCTNAGSRGLDVHDASQVSARYTNFSGAGMYGVRAANACVVTIREADCSNAGTHGLYAMGAAVVNAQTAIFSGAVQDGVRAEDGANVDAYGADASACGGAGFRANNAAVVYANSSIASGSGIGFAASGGGHVIGTSATATGCTDRGASVTAGGRADVQDANLSGATNYGVIASGGATVNATGVNAQRGGSPGSNDLRIFNGSLLTATGATGGLSVTANTITSAGIIFQ